MSNNVIEFEHVGKQYILGSIGTGTLGQDLNRWWARVRGKEFPFLKIGEANDRIRKGNCIASLLEVDTGIHPGMTGREDIYTNGSIMVMTKAEILGKFDIIVDSACLKKYVYTP